MSEIPLADLVKAVELNLPSASLILDPAGNSIIFYRYKGTLASAYQLEITPDNIRQKFKIAAIRGTTLALNVASGTDLSDIITEGILPPEAFDKNKLTNEILEAYMDHPRDYLNLEDSFRLVFIVREEEYPSQLQDFIDSGDLKIIRITP